MGPEFHLEMIAHRTAELYKEADGYRLAREVEKSQKGHSDGRRRRGLFGKIIPA